MKKKITSSGQVRVNAYAVLSDCVEKGIDYGYMRAHKHVDNPDENHLKNEIFQAVMNDICEYFSFEDSCSGEE